MALPHNTKFYRLGNGGNMRFEQDLDALSEYLGRPHPEFLGTQMDHQPGRELQWVITADLRGKKESPISMRIQFSVMESNWLDGLARAMQEALARLCGQHVTALYGTRFAHFAMHDSIGGPRALSPHPELKYHVEHLDTMLHDTQKELDNYRVYANQIRAHLARKTDTVRILAYERKILRKQRVKKDAIIAHLRTKIVSLEATVRAQEDQLNEMEEEDEDPQGEEAFMSDGEDFEDTDLEDYEFLEAGEDNHTPIEMAPPTRSANQDAMMQMLEMMMADREAERAERQANIAALQQIAQNNNGHGNHDHPGSKLKNFQNTNPPIFDKTEEPLDADDWLQTMENNLEVA
ncbi:hypothetical protein QYE76_048832 [Lolium multiflorum]|uniref:Uncharacterized protein n=1 Tax=Lolium multiflorum TaxID=4521 RepID=A0AAD8SLS3_LOLMU|nr:hypothetical protein QYE76_048832 [Lolium multiflorum]